MKIEFRSYKDFGKFLVYYEIIPCGYIAKIINKTKTHLNENDVFIFKNFKELEDYFKGEQWKLNF